MPGASDKGLFSLFRDSTSRAGLEKFMVARGVDPYTAKDAAARCEKAALTNGALGSIGLGLLSLFATSPVAGLGAPAGATIGLMLGASGTIAFSKQCKEVQDAAFEIVNDRSLD